MSDSPKIPSSSIQYKQGSSDTEKVVGNLDGHEAVTSGGLMARAGKALKAVRFRFEVFLGEVKGLFGYEISTSTPATSRSEINNLTKWNPDFKEVLSDFIDFSKNGDPVENLRLDDCTDVELNRIQRNIVRLKEAGGVDALNTAAANYRILANDTNNKNVEEKKSYKDFSEICKNAADALQQVEDKVINVLWMRVGEGYEALKEQSFNERPVDAATKGVSDALLESVSSHFDSLNLKVGRFSKEFSRELFEDLKNSKEPALTKRGFNSEGREVPLTQQAWEKDLERSTLADCVLVDENGDQRILSDIAREGKPKGYKPSKEDLLKALREFCGYDFNQKEDSAHNITIDNKLFKISQYLCQNLGNTYLTQAASSKLFPQHLADGAPFLIGASAVEHRLSLTKHQGGGFTVEASAEYSNVAQISIVDVEKGSRTLSTDPFKEGLQYRVGIDLAEGRDGNLTEQEYTTGYCNYDITILPKGVSARKGALNLTFSKDLFDFTLNNVTVLSGDLISDAGKKIERQLDKAVRLKKDPNEMVFEDEDGNKFSLNNRTPYPKDDPSAKKQWVADFIAEVKQFYIKTYGESEADRKLIKFSEKIIGLKHFDIDGEDIVLLGQFIEDLPRWPSITMNENGKSIVLNDLESNPCPSSGAERENWVKARIKSLMEYCGYVEGGDVASNNLALKNMMILSSVANQGIQNSYFDMTQSETCLNSPQFLRDDEGKGDGEGDYNIRFTVPDRATTSEIVISKEQGGFLVKNKVASDKNEFEKVFLRDYQSIPVDKENSFYNLDLGIFLMPTSRGELEPRVYTDGSLQYNIQEQSK